MEQKQVRSQFSHETMEELRKRVLDLEEQNRVLDAFIEMKPCVPALPTVRMTY